MLIEADPLAYGLRQTIARNVSELQPVMEGVVNKRRRCTSSTSFGSAVTQLSYVSEDSGSPSASPTEGQGSRPLFRLESQEEVPEPVYAFGLSNDAVANGNGLSTAASTNHSVSPTGTVTNRNALSTGTLAYGTRTIAGVLNQKKAESDKRSDFETRRALIKAKRLYADRRRSESIVTHRSRETLVPMHCSQTTTCMQGSSMLEEVDDTFQKRAFCGNCAAGVSRQSSLWNLGVNECSHCNDSLNLSTSGMRVDGQDHGYRRMNGPPPPRAKSVDGLNDRFYESLGPPSNTIKRDTEIYIVDNEAGVRLSRKRLNSTPSDESPEGNQTEARLNSDAESGYVRTAASENKGYFSTVSDALRRHGVAVLVVCNLLLLVVTVIITSYIMLRPPSEMPPNMTVAADPDAGNCFKCWDMPFDTKKEGLETGLLFINDKNQCCFKSSEDMNSWVIKGITADQTKGSFAYVTGDASIEIDSKHRIQWKDNKIGPMTLSKDRTAIVVNKQGFYFIFSRVQFFGSDACKDNELDFSHTINKAAMVGDQTHRVLVENISRGCPQIDDVTEKDHISVLETIAHLKDGDQVFVGIQKTDMVSQYKHYSVGIIMIQ